MITAIQCCVESEIILNGVCSMTMRCTAPVSPVTYEEVAFNAYQKDHELLYQLFAPFESQCEHEYHEAYGPDCDVNDLGERAVKFTDEFYRRMSRSAGLDSNVLSDVYYGRDDLMHRFNDYAIELGLWFDFDIIGREDADDGSTVSFNDDGSISGVTLGALGASLRSMRESKQVSVEELADAMNIRPEEVSALESGDGGDAGMIGTLNAIERLSDIIVEFHLHPVDVTDSFIHDNG